MNELTFDLKERMLKAFASWFKHRFLPYSRSAFTS